MDDLMMIVCLPFNSQIFNLLLYNYCSNYIEKLRSLHVSLKHLCVLTTAKSNPNPVALAAVCSKVVVLLLLIQV